jgi:hypothetical protein
MKSVKMVLVAAVFGVALVLQGLCFWMVTGFDTDRVMVAFPGFLGVGLILIGLFSSLFPGARMHLMHLSILLALAGITVGVVVGLGSLRPEETNWLGVWNQSVLILISLTYFGFCLASFVQARRSRARVTGPVGE